MKTRVEITLDDDGSMTICGSCADEPMEADEILECLEIATESLTLLERHATLQ